MRKQTCEYNAKQVYPNVKACLSCQSAHVGCSNRSVENRDIVDVNEAREAREQHQRSVGSSQASKTRKRPTVSDPIQSKDTRKLKSAEVLDDTDIEMEDATKARPTTPEVHASSSKAVPSSPRRPSPPSTSDGSYIPSRSPSPTQITPT